jgi:BASS family bile acid:Na+ symporter
MITPFLGFLGRHATALLAGAVFIGLAAPPLAALLRPLLATLIFLLTAATLIRIDWPAVLWHARRPGRLALVLGASLVLSPLLAAVAARLLRLPMPLEQAVVLWAASPPLTSAPAIAMLVGLDGALALLGMVGGTLLMPLTLPPLVLWLIGLELHIGVFELMARLALFVGGAMALALVSRKLIGAARVARRGTEIAGLTVLILVLFAIAIMDGVRDTILARPLEAVLYVAAGFGFTLALQLVTTLAFLRLGRVAALTIGMLCGNSNLAIVWASLGHGVTPELMLFFAVIQLPIYMLPAALAPVYRWLTDGTPDAARNTRLRVAETRR